MCGRMCVDMCNQVEGVGYSLKVRQFCCQNIAGNIKKRAFSFPLSASHQYTHIKVSRSPLS